MKNTMIITSLVVGTVAMVALLVAVMGVVSIADGNVNTDAARFVGWILGK